MEATSTCPREWKLVRAYVGASGHLCVSSIRQSNTLNGSKKHCYVQKALFPPPSFFKTSILNYYGVLAKDKYFLVMIYGDPITN